MPSYDGRRNELKAALVTAAPGLQGAELVRITGVLDDYLNQRDAILTTIAVRMSDDGKEPMAAEFNGRLRDAIRAAQDKLDNMLSGLSTPSDAAVQFREQVSFAEMAFWAMAGSLRAAEARDAIVADAAKVTEMIAVLDKRWQNLSEEDLRVEEAEQRAATELKVLLENALQEAMPYYVQVIQGINLLKSRWTSIGLSITDHIKEVLVQAGIPRPILDALLKVSRWANDAAFYVTIAGAAGVPVAAVMDALNKLRSINVGLLLLSRVKLPLDEHADKVMEYLGNGNRVLKPLVENRYQALMAQYKAALDNEGVIIVAYGGIRQQVDEFLKSCSLDTIRNVHAFTLNELSRVDAGLRTDGQKSDWREVARAIKDALDARKLAAEGAFERFYRANDGRFLGGLSTATEQALLQPDRWQVTISGVVAVGLDSKLREWRQAVTVVQGGPPDAFSQIQDAFLGLPLDIRDDVRDQINGHLREKMTALNAEADRNLETLQQSTLMVNAERISTDMDRSRLRAALRATVR